MPVVIQNIDLNGFVGACFISQEAVLKLHMDCMGRSIQDDVCYRKGPSSLLWYFESDNYHISFITTVTGKKR